MHNPFGDISQVTIRTLMQHAAGFRDADLALGWRQAVAPIRADSWEQLAAMLPYTEMLSEPGTQYRYSNPGIVFLGRIIQALSGEDFEVYVTKNILMPLGMHRTFFDRAPYHLFPIARTATSGRTGRWLRDASTSTRGSLSQTAV